MPGKHCSVVNAILSVLATDTPVSETKTTFGRFGSRHQGVTTNETSPNIYKSINLPEGLKKTHLNIIYGFLSLHLLSTMNKRCNKKE